MIMDSVVTLQGIGEFERVLKNECVVYGAGGVATTVLRYAKLYNIKVDRIIVTEKSNNPIQKMGVKVYSLEECLDYITKKNVLVCTLEDKHGEIAEQISGLGIENVYYIGNLLYQKIMHDIGEYEERISCEINLLRREVERLNSYKKFIPKPCLEVLVVNILDHCNLRCRGCDHFGCIAEPYFVPYETIKSDLEQMSKILKGSHILRMGIEGGEPLLHPDLLKIVKVARMCFPYIPIRIVTNGLLLKMQKDEFWKILREYNIEIWVTRYPINLDFEGMQKKADEENVKFKYWCGTDINEKKLFKKIIDLNGENDPVERFAHCYVSNYGNFLMEGKLYSCPFSCQSYRIFNKKFNQNLIMTEDDYLDIYQVEDMKELFSFAARPKYYCRYCNGNDELFEWSRSKGEMEEWV